MTLKSTLLKSVAVLSMTAGSALAENHTAAADQSAATSQAANPSSDYPLGWDSDLDARYADIADRPVDELIGIDVISSRGEDVGEIDNFVIIGDQLRAVVGVGGFLGLGEHEVALALADLEYDGEQIIVPFTEEELEAMPEYTEATEQITLSGTDTFRTRGDMQAPADSVAGMAGTQLEVDRDATAMTEGADDTVAEGQPLTEESENLAENTGDAVAEGAAEAEQTAENMASEAGNALEQAGDETAQAAEAAGNAVEEGANQMAEAADNAATATGNWFERVSAELGELADAPITEFENKEVVSAEGQVVGEVDNVAMLGGQPVAIVGIGGFIGVGEHDVALDLTQLSWNGEQFVIQGYTEQELKEMPEVDVSDLEMLDSDATLRSHARM